MSSRTGLALLVLLGFDTSPTFHIAFVFGKGGRKGVTAGSICDKIQILSCRGMENSVQGGSARIGDRCGRQARQSLGVVWGVLFQIGSAQRPAKGPGAVG